MLSLCLKVGVMVTEERYDLAELENGLRTMGSRDEVTGSRRKLGRYSLIELFVLSKDDITNELLAVNFALLDTPLDYIYQFSTGY